MSDDQPRWPAGTPVAPGGKGPGGGRFRGIGVPGRGGWVEQVSGRFARGWANDDRSRDELFEVVQSAASAPDGMPPGATMENYSGDAATVWRIDLPDGRSVVRKSYDEALSDYYDGEYDEQYDDDDGEYLSVDDPRRRPAKEDEVHARAEWVSARVARAVGALVPPVVFDPQWGGAVWMGWVDGKTGINWDFEHQDKGATLAAKQDMWRLGLLDLLIINSDRHELNWLFTEDGRVFGIDHGYAGLFTDFVPTEAIGAISPFAQLYYDSGEKLKPNILHPDDIDDVIGRLGGLWEDGTLSEPEYNYMVRVMNWLRPHATGTRRLIP